MSTLQVRDVPDDVKQILKVRAAAAGQSLSEYVLHELQELTGRPTLAELSARIEARGTYAPTRSAADVLADERAARR
ncbi:hypothetical protein ATJ88_2137 [Isoptericola jiangsuensis]|uniref:Antitoxin FitA-like ribbon-helix-helix domain-containing protein n=1 Tax=Isoptericola jiangsuensis TaxID=548579 RepID=A0A2A9EYX1_9MICO|nr:antitoxin [Isoptericola jiangsuensis]PFG43440.1 hypothetical protein ATJ88_2137 [Isoptericola jiangsuensis]